MIFLQTVGLIIIFVVCILFVATAYKVLREIKHIYTKDSDDTDLDLTKKQ